MRLFKVFLVGAISLLSLNACDYKAESLPKHIINDYEVAFPLTDTAFRLADFFRTDARPITSITISPATPVILTVEFPTYLVDLTGKGYTIAWIEPKIFTNNAFTNKIDVSFSYYARTKSGATHLLLANQTLPQGENSQLQVVRLESSGTIPISQVGIVYVNITLTAKESGITNAELLEGSLGLKLGLKAGLRAGFSL